MPKVRLNRQAALVLLVVLFACSGADEQLLTHFFTAVDAGDESAVSALSMAEFTGKVASWEILEVAGESKIDFDLAGLRDEAVEAKRELENSDQRNRDFLAANQKAYLDYRSKIAEDPDFEFKGETAEFQKEWEPRLEAQHELERQLEAANERVNELRKAAGLSLNTQVSSTFEGDVDVRDVKLKVNDGSNDQTYTFRLQRFNLRDAETNISPIARWIIAEIRES